MNIRDFLLFILLISHLSICSQDQQRYFEDQFYLGLSYNSLGGKINEFKENKFSYSINYGFIKDLPINKKRNYSFGLGIGLGHNTLNNNLSYSFFNNTSNFNFIENASSVKVNRYNYTELQIPIELRWRNSSYNNYSFWRVYAGVRYSRIISSKYIFDDNITINKTKEFPVNKNQLGVIINIGYNTWNISVYQSIDNFFNYENNPNLSGLKQFRLGFIFYIF